MNSNGWALSCRPQSHLIVLEERKQKSTHSFGAKSMKAHGSPKANTLLVSYVQLLISFAKAFDAVMKVICGDPLNPFPNKSSKEIIVNDYCLFGVISLGLMLWGVVSFVMCLVLFAILHIANMTRYSILYDGKEMVNAIWQQPNMK